MSNLKNKVQLIGFIGEDPKITVLDSGKKVANLSIATTDKYNNSNGDKVESTEWHQLRAWNGKAEIVEKFVKKGSQIAIEGKLTTRTYEDKEGKKRYTTEVLVSEILLLNSK